MSKRVYGQFCGLVRALELVGERWALIIIRDLLVGPRRFSELKRGLPRIPTNVLSERLRELEAAAIVRRRILPRPATGVVYELTEYGQDLEDVVLRLGRWGARSMTVPRPGDIVTPDALVLAMRACFQPDAARDADLRYELRLGPIVLAVHVDHGRVHVTQSADPDADLVIETGPVIRALLAHELSPAQALADGHVHLTGPPALLDRFVDLFTIPPAPAALSS